MSYKAFQNGVYFFLNLTAPFQLSTCYNDESGQTGYDLYSDWASTAASSTISNVVSNTDAYFNGEGGQFIQELAPVWSCYQNTEDEANLNNAIGYNISSNTFYQMIESYYTGNPIIYYATFQGINHGFTSTNPLGAGAGFAEFLLLVAGKIPADSDSSEI